MQRLHVDVSHQLPTCSPEANCMLYTHRHHRQNTYSGISPRGGRLSGGPRRSIINTTVYPPLRSTLRADFMVLCYTDVHVYVYVCVRSRKQVAGLAIRTPWATSEESFSRKDEHLGTLRIKLSCSNQECLTYVQHRSGPTWSESKVNWIIPWLEWVYFELLIFTFSKCLKYLHSAFIMSMFIIIWEKFYHVIF